jgi:hypothetical protein
MHGAHAHVTLSQTFVINNEHQYIWRIVEVTDINNYYITYMVCGVNNQGWVNVVVPRKWAMPIRKGNERQ